MHVVRNSSHSAFIHTGESIFNEESMNWKVRVYSFSISRKRHSISGQFMASKSRHSEDALIKLKISMNSYSIQPFEKNYQNLKQSVVRVHVTSVLFPNKLLSSS